MSGVDLNHQRANNDNIMASETRKDRRRRRAEEIKTRRVAGRTLDQWQRNIVNQMVDEGVGKDLGKQAREGILPPPMIAFMFNIPYMENAFAVEPRYACYLAKIHPDDYNTPDLENATLRRSVLPAFEKWQGNRDVLGFPKIIKKDMNVLVKCYSLKQYESFWKTVKRVVKEHNTLFFEGPEDSPFVFTPATLKGGEFTRMTTEEMKHGDKIIDGSVRASRTPTLDN